MYYNSLDLPKTNSLYLYQCMYLHFTKRTTNQFLLHTNIIYLKIYEIFILLLKYSILRVNYFISSKTIQGPSLMKQCYLLNVQGLQTCKNLLFWNFLKLCFQFSYNYFKQLNISSSMSIVLLITIHDYILTEQTS